MRALRVKCSKDALLTVERSRQWNRRMVYVLVADRSFKYSNGRRSRIIYIGTTGKGARRPATSAVDKASEAFANLRGVKKIEVHIATCRGRKAVKTWKHLESSLLAVFRDRYWKLPEYNRKKGSVRFAEDVDLFRTKALLEILQRFGD
jgi:hypothetical protein